MEKVLSEIRTKLLASGYDVETSKAPREHLHEPTTMLRVCREGTPRMVILADARDAVEIVVTTVNGFLGTTYVFSTSVDGTIAIVEEAFVDAG